MLHLYNLLFWSYYFDCKNPLETMVDRNKKERSWMPWTLEVRKILQSNEICYNKASLMNMTPPPHTHTTSTNSKFFKSTFPWKLPIFRKIDFGSICEFVLFVSQQYKEKTVACLSKVKSYHTYSYVNATGMVACYRNTPPYCSKHVGAAFFYFCSHTFDDNSRKACG